MDVSASCCPRLTLIATPRPSERDRQNLFVRLAPQTAWRLASSLINSSSTTSDDYANGGDTAVHDVDFLPLEIVIFPKGAQNLDELDDVGGGTTMHASYNGGSPSAVGLGSRNYKNIIELPLDLHPSLQSVFNSTSDPIFASVRVLTNVPIAERVTFEPLSVSDWEMIEMESTLLEDGGLLNQITVVSPNQVFPLNFGRNFGSVESSAWIKVVDDDNHTTDDCNSTFSSSDSDIDASPDHTDDDDNCTSAVRNNNHRCVRLMAETEVVVIPKPRMRIEEPKDTKTSLPPPMEEPVFCPSTPLRVQFNLSDVHQTSLANEAFLSLPNPPLGYVFVHPSTLTRLPGYQHCIATRYQNDQPKCADEEYPQFVVTVRRVRGPFANYSHPDAGKDHGTGDDVAVAIVHASDSTREGHIGMNSLLRYQLGVSPLSRYVTIQLWSESQIMDSIASARVAEGKRIKITKVSITIPPAFLDRCSILPKCDTLSSTCKHCEGANCDSSSVTPTRRNTMGTDPVFCSGSILSSEFLRELDPGRRKCSDMLMLTIQPISDTPGDSIIKSEFSQTISHCLVPIITTKHLRELLRSDTIETDKTCKVKSVDAHSYSSMLPTLHSPTVGFTSAIQSMIRSAKQIIHRPKFDSHNLFAPHSTINNAIMITGEVGSGKTHLAITAALQLAVSEQFATVYLDCKKLQATSTSIKHILEEIQKSFHDALQKQPSVLVLDDLNALIPKVEFSDGEGDGSIHHHILNPALVTQVKVTVDQLLLQSQYCSSSSRVKSTQLTGIVLVCTCRDKDSISTRYQESGIFHSLIEVPSLNATQRAQLVHNELMGHAVLANEKIPHVISRLGKDTDGCRPKDLRIVATRIMHLDYLRNLHCHQEETQSSLKMLESDIASIIESYSPLSQQLVDVDPNTCSLDWDSIGGLLKAKQSLFDIIIHPMRFKSVYDNAPMTLPTGILLYGPPGNGKSFIVPLLAKTSKLTLITCHGPELLDRYIGASEAKVRQLFARATAAAPSMIFFDEFDSLAPQRGSDHTGVTDRVVNQLLTLLDGAERSKDSNYIFVVAATSRPDKIDKALLRPGRLEKHVYVGYPESLVEWNSLFSSLLNARNVDDEVSCLQQSGDLYSTFCKDFDHAKDFSAADMKAVLDTAHLLCVHEILDTSDREAGVHPILRKSHILEAFKRTRTSLLPTDRRVLQSIYASFGDLDVKQETPARNMEDNRLKTSLR
ncbi:hypothetical protein ACHAXH_006391 [Discostella pseudostelligera]